MMQLKLPKYLHDFLVKQANDNGVSVQRLIRENLINYMNSDNGETSNGRGNSKKV